MWNAPYYRHWALQRHKTRLAGVVAVAALGGALILAPALQPQNAIAQDSSAALAGALSPNTFADVAEQVSPAVVNIQTTQQVTGAAFRDGRRGDDPREFFERFFGPDERNPFDRRGQRRDRDDRFGDRFDRDDRDRRGDGPQRRFSRGLGSGFIIDEGGIVVTNDHVVGDADEITVTLQNGDTLDAELIGRDPQTDLAVLQVETDEPLPAVDFGEVEDVRVGDLVVAVGNPFGLGHTVTVGVVSARGRDIGAGPFDDFLQIDASINRGNSGGPTFNLAGEVIGINSAIFSPTGGNVGIGFAIPASLAQEVIDELLEDGEIQRGFLGVNIQRVTEDIAASVKLDEPRGAIVARVLPDTPAARAGLEVGDVILAVDDDDVARMRDLPRLIANIDAGEDARLTVWRDGETIEVTASIAALDNDRRVASRGGPAPRDDDGEVGMDDLGVAFADLDDEIRRRLRLDDDATGAVVVDVDPDSVAAQRGLRRGDLITAVGGDPVTSADEAAAAIEAARADNGEAVLLSVARGRGGERLVALPLGTS